jgi:hypothetical protein
MNTSNRQGGVIWTNHALERLKARNIPQELILSAFRTPDAQFAGKKANTVEFHKKIGIHSVTVIATKNERSEWVLLSCWVEPPMPGSIDIEKKKTYQEYKNASVWKKLWMNLKKQLGFSNF